MLKRAKVFLCVGVVFALFLTIFPTNTVTAVPGKNNSTDLIVKKGTTTYTGIELNVESVKISHRGTLVLENVILRVENEVEVCNQGTLILTDTQVYAGAEIGISNEGVLTASYSFLECKQFKAGNRASLSLETTTIKTIEKAEFENTATVRANFNTKIEAGTEFIVKNTVGFAVDSLCELSGTKLLFENDADVLLSNSKIISAEELIIKNKVTFSTNNCDLTAGSFSAKNSAYVGIKDSTVTVSGNLEMENECSVSLENSFLYMNSTATEQRSISAKNEVKFSAKDSTITALKPAYLYNLIFKDDAQVSFVDTEISYSTGIKMMPGYVIPELVDCTISHSPRGIWIAELSPTICGHKIIYNDIGIWLEDSAAIIKNNEISYNRIGIYLVNSNPTITDNIFAYNTEYAIWYSVDSEPILANNIYIGTGWCYKVPHDWTISTPVTYEDGNIIVEGDFTATTQVQFINMTITTYNFVAASGSNITCIDVDISVSGDLIVEQNAVLTISSGSPLSTVGVNGAITISGALYLTATTLEVGLKLFVNPTGELVGIDSKIVAKDPTKPFEFVDRGKMRLQNCDVSYLAGVTTFKGGIQIYSDNVEIVDSRISHSAASGIYILNSQPKKIDNNLIEACAGAGIYYENPSIKVFEPKRLTTDVHISETPAIAIDNKDNIHVVWADNRNGHFEIYYKQSKDFGNSWFETKITNVPYDSYEPDVAVDSKGIIHVVFWNYWEGWGLREYIYKWWVSYIKSSDGGISWTAPQTLAEYSVVHYVMPPAPPLTIATPQIVVGNNDILHVAFGFDDPLGGGVGYVRSVDSGSTWSDVTELAYGLEDALARPVALADKIVYVAWHEWDSTGNYWLRLARSKDDGLNWDMQTVVQPQSAECVTPSIAVTDGIVYLAWIDARTGDYEIFYKTSKDYGVTWSDDIRLTYGGTTAYFEQIISDNAGNLYFVWTDWRDGNGEIYYALLDQKGYRATMDVRLAEDVAESWKPAIALDSEHFIHIVWQDERDGNWGIYYMNNRVPTLYGNKIFNATYGIYLKNGASRLMSDVITNAEYGLYLDNSPAGIKDMSFYSGIYISADSTPAILNSYYARQKVNAESTIDTDQDGITDANELYKYGLNPYVIDNNIDTDGDSLSNIIEVEKHNTDPLNSDTDGDGVSDDVETANGQIVWYEAEDYAVDKKGVIYTWWGRKLVEASPDYPPYHDQMCNWIPGYGPKAVKAVGNNPEICYLEDVIPWDGKEYNILFRAKSDTNQVVKVIASERFEYVPPGGPVYGSVEVDFQLTPNFRFYQLPNVYIDPNAQSPIPEYGFAGSTLRFVNLVANQPFDIIVDVIAIVPSDYIGYITNPRTKDSDFDDLGDKEERIPDVLWLEVESVISTGILRPVNHFIHEIGERIQDVNANFGWSVRCDAQGIIYNLYGKFKDLPLVSGNYYNIIIKGRSIGPHVGELLFRDSLLRFSFENEYVWENIHRGRSPPYTVFYSYELTYPFEGTCIHLKDLIKKQNLLIDSLLIIPYVCPGPTGHIYPEPVTHPLIADTDGDGLTDGYEVTRVYRSSEIDWNDDGQNEHITNPLDKDTDDDGLIDKYEVETFYYDSSAVPCYRSNTDWDYSPGYEHYTNPLDPNTDNDFRNDYDEAFMQIPANHVGKRFFDNSIFYTHPLDSDSDDDNKRDGYPGMEDWFPLNVPPIVRFDVSIYADNTLNGRVDEGDELKFNVDTSATYDPDGDQLVDYYWEFGDGSGTRGVTKTTVFHTYQDNGGYDVILRVYDNVQFNHFGHSSQRVQVRNVPPQVTLTSTRQPEGGTTQFTISISDAGIADNFVYTVSFGDGVSVTGTLPRPGTFTIGHTYQNSNRYHFEISARDDDGDVVSYAVDIQIDNVPPTAVMTVDNNVVSYPGIDYAVLYCPNRGPTAVSFDGSRSYDGVMPCHSIVTYTWDFGDGTIVTSSLPTASHSYITRTASTPYTVSLTVTDDEGTTSRCALTLTVCLDTDGDGYPNDANGNGINDGYDDIDDDNDGLLDTVETNTGIYVSPTNTGTDPENHDTDGDGSWDGTEVKFFEKTGTNPNEKELVVAIRITWGYILYQPAEVSNLVVTCLGTSTSFPTSNPSDFQNWPDDKCRVGLYYSWGGTTSVTLRISFRGHYKNVGLNEWDFSDSLVLTIRSGTQTGKAYKWIDDPAGNYDFCIGFEYKVLSTGPNEPPWGPLAKELAPHLIYEDINQEFPTSIFFDGDRDMSNNGVPATWPGRGITFGRTYRVLEVRTVRSILQTEDFFLCDFDMIAGVGYADLVQYDIFNPSPPPIYVSIPAHGPVGRVYNWDGQPVTVRIQYYVGYGGYRYDYVTLTVSDSTVASSHSGYEGYQYRYNIPESDKGRGYYSHGTSWKICPVNTAVYVQAFARSNLLGIQYWFYYPFHDDPGLFFHKHDWWYVWVVYDTTSYKPVKVIHDFHHNLRATDWTSGLIRKDNFHVKVWSDAGGHRSLYSPGADLDASDYAAYILGARRLSQIIDGDANDKTFGVLIKHGKGYTGEVPSLNFWRRDNSDYNEGITLNVEGFNHWVWVYGVERNDADGDRVPDQQYRDSLNQPYSTVHFTYTHPSGQNLFNVDHAEWWPTHYNVGGALQSVYMPWFSGFTQKDAKYISTTELIWYWHASDYNPTGSPSPSATTRYYDGSP